MSLTAACGGDIGAAVVRSFARIFVAVDLDVAYGGDGFVSAGKWGVRFSEDGGSFSRATTPEGTIVGLISRAAAFGDAGWVAADLTGVFTSADGRVWRKSEALPDSDLSGAAFGAGRYVLVGSGGRVMVSPDAVVWQDVDPPTAQDILGVAFVGGRFIAVGRGGFAAESADGVAWSSLGVPTDRTLRGVAGADGVVVLAGEGGTLLRSTDGATFAAVESGVRSYLTAATFARGRCVVVGEDAVVLVSDDAAATFRRVRVDLGDDPFDIGRHLYGVAYGEGVFVAVGTADIVSPDGESWTLAVVPEAETQPPEAPEEPDLGTVREGSL